MSRFVERVGGILVAPLATLKEAASEGRGAADVAWLIAFKLLAGSTIAIAGAVSRGIDTGLGSGVMALVAVLGAVLPDVVAILVGGVLLSLFSPGGKGARDRALDLAAYAWIPYLAVETAAVLFFALGPYAPSPRLETVVFAIGIGWSLAVWLCALVVLKRREEAVP